MSQNMINADFKDFDRPPVYITNDSQYAKAQKDEWQVMTGDKYEVSKLEFFAVRRKRS